MFLTTICTHIICLSLTTYVHNNCTAPKDSAFDKLSTETIEYLTYPANVDVLSSYLTYHAVSGNVTSSDLVDSGNPSETDVATLNGDDILVSVGYGGEYGILINNDASVIDPFDVIACNGVIHSLDTVLEPPPPTTPSPSSKPTSNGSSDCYNSTLAILMAQTQGSKDFILCPNTTIDIGVPANPQFTDFINGDFPLLILVDGVTVQCGHDGLSTNKCVLNGGFIQLVSTPNNPLFSDKITSNDLKVQGLTFSGTLQGGDNILTAAIAVGTVGTNMIVEDCIFTNLEESDHVVFMSASLSSPEDLLPQQSTLTISNSVFTDINYKREILKVVSQTLIVQGSTFHNIEYQSCGCNESSLFVAADDANMSVEDTSISNVEVLTSVVILYGDTEFTTKALSVSNTTIYDKDSRPEDEYCEEGLVVERVENGAHGMSVLSFWKTRLYTHPSQLPCPHLYTRQSPPSLRVNHPRLKLPRGNIVIYLSKLWNGIFNVLKCFVRVTSFCYQNIHKIKE